MDTIYFKLSLRLLEDKIKLQTLKYSVKLNLYNLSRVG